MLRKPVAMYNPCSAVAAKAVEAPADELPRGSTRGCSAKPTRQGGSPERL